ncbi:MAG: hypothetical protein HN389_09635 [Clostridia bacterium]|jgi:hypothetical protein|nr:hypothetical protein [Clostridia bacterium]
MSNTIIDTANEYKKVAQMLETSAIEAGSEEIRQGFIEDALLRLFYAKSLELKLDKVQEQLDEQSDMDTFDAVNKAEEAIEKVSEMSFEQIESYAGDDKKFEIEVDSTSVDLDSQDKENLLRQLYKCEGIIRMAHRTAQRHSIYGNTSAAWEHLEGLDTEGGKSPEQMIFEDLGIDMYELLGVREKLVDKIEGMVAG